MKRKKVAKKAKPVFKRKSKPVVRKPKIELSPRKIQIVKLICRQLTSKEIGEKIGLSKKTVEVHRVQLFNQLKIKNNVGLAIWAIKNGLYKV
jgi:DNA-binding NarL/FixJ family response regulator